jgi:hypothetical protein
MTADVGIYALGADPQVTAAAAALGARGARVTLWLPPAPLTLAWRVSRRLAGGSVAARMAVRDGYAAAFAALAARQIAARRHDVVITDLATARAVPRGTAHHVLLLERGTSDAIHSALDAESARAPEFREHLHRYRASAAACQRERDAIASAHRVVASSHWIARSARAAGARAVRVVAPLAPPFPWRPAPRSERAIRVLAPGPLIGRNGAHALLECAYWMDTSVELQIAGRVADDPEVVRPYVPYFRTSALRFEECCREADIVVAPWLIDGYCHDVARAIASGIPVIATEATGAERAPRVGLVREGSVQDLVVALEAFRADRWPDAPAARSESGTEQERALVEVALP